MSEITTRSEFIKCYKEYLNYKKELELIEIQIEVTNDEAFKKLLFERLEKVEHIFPELEKDIKKSSYFVLTLSLADYLEEIKRQKQKAELIKKQAELESGDEKAGLIEKLNKLNDTITEMVEPITSLYNNVIKYYLVTTRFENEDGRPRSAVPYNEYTAAYLMITGAYDPDSFDYKKMIALDNAVNGTHNDWLNDMSNLLINPPLNPLVIDTMKNIRPYSSQEYVDCFPRVTPTVLQLTELSGMIKTRLTKLGISENMTISDVQSKAIELTKDLSPIDLDKEIENATRIFKNKDLSVCDNSDIIKYFIETFC